MEGQRDSGAPDLSGLRSHYPLRAARGLRRVLLVLISLQVALAVSRLLGDPDTFDVVVSVVVLLAFLHGAALCCRHGARLGNGRSSDGRGVHLEPRPDPLPRRLHRSAGVSRVAGFAPRCATVPAPRHRARCSRKASSRAPIAPAGSRPSAGPRRSTETARTCSA